VVVIGAAKWRIERSRNFWRQGQCHRDRSQIRDGIAALAEEKLIVGMPGPTARDLAGGVSGDRCNR